MSRKRREGGGGKGSGAGAVTDAVSMDGGLREVSVSVVFSVWCLLFLLRSQFLHSQTDDPSSGSSCSNRHLRMLASVVDHVDPSTISREIKVKLMMLHCSS